MRSLAGFAAFAKKVGGVPLVPLRSPAWGTSRGTGDCPQNQLLNEPVPHVPHVPLENNDAGNELADWFEERAAILECDGGWPRAEAERIARAEVFGEVA